MKTNIFIILSILFFINNVNAQIVSEKEIKGVQNVYVQQETKGSYLVFNKNNKLAEIAPSYLLYKHTPPVTVGNKSELDKIVYSYLTPYFKKNNLIFSRNSALTLSFFSDINGNIMEMRLMYPKQACVIPVIVIEEFENALLQSNVKLVFDKNKREFEGTAWVGQYVIYDPDKLREYKE